MRESLIKEIKGTDDVTNAIVLTHNIDFIFLQSVVLRELKNIGHPKLTVFADAQCASDSFANQYKLLDSIGIRYRVVPVLMKPGFRFHPKAVFLSGPEKGILYIGSGNLTFGGWYENAEVWCRIDSDVDGTAPFSAFKHYLKQIISMVPISETIFTEVGEAFDINTKGWAVELDEPDDLIGKVKSGDSLIDQVLTSIEDKNATSLFVCAPYFDPEAEALRKLVEQLGDINTKVLVQNGRSGLNKSAASSLPSNIETIPVTFYHENPGGEARQGFIHAKFYAVDHGDSVTVFLGSANCSRAALTIPGASGNAELLVIKKLSQEEFQQQFLDEFELLEGDPELSEDVKEPDCNLPGLGEIKVLAARYDAGDLLIGYTCSKGISVNRCFVDRVQIDFELLGHGEALAKLHRPCKYVMLEGIINKEVVRSDLCWVDHEMELRTTARGRSLADTIRSKVISDYWNLGAWADILTEFYKHLQYIPFSPGFKLPKNRKGDKSRAVEYSEDDVFSSGYGIHAISSGTYSFAFDIKIRNLQQLLLRWFGYSAHEDDSDDNDLPGEDENDDEDIVDRPENWPTKKRKKKNKVDSQKEKRRAKKFVDKLTGTMCSRNYLEYRPPELLGSDLKLVVVLLLTGLRENWISHEDFFEATHRIWSKLFFTSKIKRNIGWLEHRYQTSEFPEGFIERMVSSDLSAALFVWTLAIPFDFSTPNTARFTFSCIASVARLPWLWHGGSCDEIAHVLEKDFLQHAYHNKSDGYSTSQRWLLMIRLGHIIRKFNNEVGDRNVVDFKEVIKQDIIRKGELLWQGSSGFCIATKSYKRDWPYFTKVLSLQRESKEIEFKPESYIPVRALIDEAVIPSTEKFNDKHKKYLRLLAKRIQNQFTAIKENNL